jgi:hypothetical protein
LALLDSEPQPRTITDRVVAQFNSYEGMLAAMVARAKEQRLVITSPEVAEISGLPAAYVAKLLSPKSPRRIGSISMAPVLAILGCRLALIEDRDAMERYTSRVKKHDLKLMHGGSVHFAISRRELRKRQQNGGLNSRKYMSPREARALARKAANARWSKAAAKAA